MKNLIAILSSLILAGNLYGEVTLPGIIGKNMVLQRNKSIPVWGWAEPGEKVTVELSGEKVSTKTGKDGKWKLKLSPKKAGGPYAMTIKGKNTIVFKNILIGEVWICSGQSNMGRSVIFAQTGGKALKEAEYPQIRLFQVRRVNSPVLYTDTSGAWSVCRASGRNVRSFSAVGYFFGLELYKKLNVPIGLIQSTWGGTNSRVWTSSEGFSSVPELKRMKELAEVSQKKFKKELRKPLARIHKWLKSTEKSLSTKDKLQFNPTLFEIFKNPEHPSSPSCLYNGMIFPLVPFSIRGAIWYQGEANRGNGIRYYYYMKALINGWRQAWGGDEFPFYYVQLAPYNYGGGPNLAEAWEGQRLTLNIPNTGMAVINDIGNVKDIHPKNKLDVGKRLALWALAKTYKQKGIVFSGPLYKSMKVERTKIRIFFNHVGSGLKSRNGKNLDWFEIAGKNGRFQKANAKIEKDTVIVWSDKVKQPASVRFAWRDIAEPNLINKEGLPASSFATDSKIPK